MVAHIQALLVEDSAVDAELILIELKRSGFQVEAERVETRADMEEALARTSWDVIIADYSLPTFDGQAALELAKSQGTDIPFVVVSGTIGEDSAVAMMRAGAHDYLMKDRLERLGAAVERELAEAVVRRERREAREALEKRVNELSALNNLFQQQLGEQIPVIETYRELLRGLEELSQATTALLERARSLPMPGIADSESDSASQPPDGNSG